MDRKSAIEAYDVVKKIEAMELKLSMIDSIQECGYEDVSISVKSGARAIVFMPSVIGVDLALMVDAIRAELLRQIKEANDQLKKL